MRRSDFVSWKQGGTMIFKHSTQHCITYSLVFAIVVAGFVGCGAKPAQQAQSSSATDTDTDAAASGSATTLPNVIDRETREPPKCGFDLESINELHELSTEEVQLIVAGHRTTPRLKYFAAMCLYHGIHLPADSAASATLLLDAGEAGYPDACLTLAVAFRDGKLYERDTVNGLRRAFWKAWAIQIQKERNSGIPKIARNFDVFQKYLDPKSGLVRSNRDFNLKRMQDGNAPIGSDGKSVNVHHVQPLRALGNNSFTNLTTLNATDHERNSKALHGTKVSRELVVMAQHFKK